MVLEVYIDILHNTITHPTFCLQDLTNITFPEVKKDDKTRKTLHAAIMDNDFMKNLEPGWYINSNYE